MVVLRPILAEQTSRRGGAPDNPSLYYTSTRGPHRRCVDQVPNVRYDSVFNFSPCLREDRPRERPGRAEANGSVTSPERFAQAPALPSLRSTLPEGPEGG
jgi:hypothetical protein